MVEYSYNAIGQLDTVLDQNKHEIKFDWSRFGLDSKTTAANQLTDYVYDKYGMLANVAMYSYDKKGQLLRFADMQDNVAEQYVYDPAGNILSKTIDGKTTIYTYDKANQLVTSTSDGKVTKYAYDAAGRMGREGDKTYFYGYLDKILSVQENGEQTAAFDYHVDGQIASATHGNKSENFLWDGLALIHRGETSFVNEPYVTGGNPILSSKDGVMFNDMLGNSLNIGGKSVNMTAFGETADKSAMFTGKPYIGDLGYAFIFRNYRPDQGKWNSADPLGYPDGWNNLAYVNNGVTNDFDMLGLSRWQWTKETLAALGYGTIYIFNAVYNTVNPFSYYFSPDALPQSIASMFSASAVKNISSVERAIDSYYSNVIRNYSSVSTTGTFSLSSQSYKISNNNNTAWGAIVGTSSLTISGTATVTKASDGGRDVIISLRCRFFDDIDWKSYEELVVDHDGNFLDWGLTTDYVEGAFDVWLD